MLTVIKKIFLAFSKKERVLFLVALLTAAVSSVILSNIVLANISTTLPARGGSYTEGVVGQPSFINPVIAATDTDKALVRLIFSPIGDLASKIEREDSGGGWKIRLKDGLRWQDGTKLTADDVVFTIQAIQDPDSRSPLRQSWQGVAVQRVSELELQFNLGAPYAFFEDHVRRLSILPKHLFENIPVANWRISNLNLEPVGNGPYQFESHQVESQGFITSYRLKSNPAYSGEEAFISNFYVRFFSSKEDLLAAFNAGRVDGIPGIEAEDLKDLKRPYETSDFRLPNYYAAFFNASQNIALKEEAVRHALTLTVNREEMIANIFDGQADSARGPIPAVSPYFNPELENETSSLGRAAEMLDAAGWKLAENGTREKTIKNSTVKLEFSLTVPRISFLLKTADALRSAWGKLGATVTVTEKSLDEITEGSIKNRDYQVLLFGNTLNAGFDLFPFWHSSERFYPGGNLSLYTDKEADRLIEAIRQNSDPASREAQFRSVQTVIANEYPALFLYSPYYIYVAGKNLKGVNPGFIAEPSERFLSIGEWHLKTRRVIK